MRARLLGVLGAVALATAACGGSGGAPPPAAGKYARGATFTMAIMEPGDLNPLLTALSEPRNVDFFLYDTLVSFKDDGTVIPGLATSWKTTPTSAEFTLAKGVTCADGTPLTAGDVAAGVSHIADPASKSQLLGLYVPADLKARADDKAGTVTMTVKTPDPFLLRRLASVFVVCGKGLSDPAGLKAGKHGTGLFQITESVAGDHYTLTKRPEYAWGPGGATGKDEGLPDKVVLKVVKNETTAANLLLSGQLNAAYVIGPDRARAEAKKLFKSEIRLMFGEFTYNQAQGRPAQDERVRRALTMGLDLAELQRVATAGTGATPEGLSMQPKVCPGVTTTALPAFDPAGAGALLDEAGWAKGADGVRAKDGKRLKLTFLYLAEHGDPGKSVAELMKQKWAGLGVETELRQLTSPQLAGVNDGSMDWDAGWIQVNVPLPSMMVPFLSGDGPPKGANWSSIANADYDRLVGEAGAATGDASCAKWNAAEEALYRKADIVPFADITQPLFGNGAEFGRLGGSFAPSTIRMIAR
ncbi:ABC transporter substrate-binding protein [Nonomuraea zeae]|uniref:ABC transporter substrate-binding protein n=1 Tax=Nonomuraea zeae TaxID=1642303 RepID=A0A5S4H4M5_9ACTN|nr:ABC transporter substrate-binding protein [Nonomuraea zeae]TMR39661.1 ABC transporter substrate-binding protein [Nonomuraea zeae]